MAARARGVCAEPPNVGTRVTCSRRYPANDERACSDSLAAAQVKKTKGTPSGTCRSSARRHEADSHA
eukprot:4457220-Prymnesium_polylepis.1